MKPLLNADDIILQFTLDILELRERIQLMNDSIQEKEAFLKVMKSKIVVKNSEMYQALENETSKFWKIKEVTMECRKNSFYEIKVFKKYFFSKPQIEIIEKHFMLKFSRIKADIRISQFY